LCSGGVAPQFPILPLDTSEQPGSLHGRSTSGVRAPSKRWIEGWVYHSLTVTLYWKKHILPLPTATIKFLVCPAHTPVTTPRIHDWWKDSSNNALENSGLQIRLH